MTTQQTQISLRSALSAIAALCAAVGFAVGYATWFMPTVFYGTVYLFRQFSTADRAAGHIFFFNGFNLIAILTLTLFVGAATFQLLVRPLNQRRPRRRPKRGVFAQTGRRIRIAMVVFSLLIVVVQSVLTVRSHKRDQLDMRAATFARQCSSCHTLERTLKFFRTREAWAQTVDEMNRYTRGRIPPEEVVEIVDYLAETRGLDGKSVFQGACLKCHQSKRIFSQERTLPEWQLLVERIHRQDHIYLPMDQARAIVDYINSEGHVRPEPGNDPDYDALMLVSEKCSTCHLLDVNLDRDFDDAGWKSMLRRMGEKSPDYLSEEEALSSYELLRTLSRDRAQYLRALPHSTFVF